jgi:predicted RecB family nuclease
MSCSSCYLQALFLPCFLCAPKPKQPQPAQPLSPASEPTDIEDNIQANQDQESLWHLEILMRPG